jgi:hypothetical protein
MPQLEANPQHIADYEGSFYRGVKSDVDPSQLPPNYVWSALNMLNIGGVLMCRPGMRCIVTFPDGNLQGAALFRPQVGLEQLVVAVDGIIYAAEWPFTDFRMLTNVRMAPQAKQMYWAMTVQSAERLSTELTAGIRAIEPRAVLFINDGGFTAPAWFDGSNSGHVRDNAFETPAGGPMCWVGDRLWVAVRNQVFAGDIANPFSFREQIYLGGVSSFFFNGDVTALTPTPSIEAPQLMVFTESSGSILQANNRLRDQWPFTADFQREIVQVGCGSNRSIVSHYGKLVWYSPAGVAFFDAAAAGKHTTRLPVRDNEMMRSKTTIGEDQSLIAAAVFGQYTLMSVPAEDNYNKHTWVLNNASLETLSDESGPSWCGHWVGTRPVEWVYGIIANHERIYHVSVDVDGKNRLWEAFLPNCLDNECPITWAFDTRGFFGVSAPSAQKMPGAPCRLNWADIGLAGIREDLDIAAFYAGSTRGAFKRMMAKRVNVLRGSLSPDAEIDINTEIFAFKPQSRTLRTEDVSQKEVDETGSCGIERDDLESIDESFQLLVTGHGPATVRWIRVFAQTVGDDWSGDPEACTSETNKNALRFDGPGASGSSEAEALAGLMAAPSPTFTSAQTRVVEQGGMSAIGVGTSESLVSQEAADRVAGIVAQKMAENELRMVLPKITSVGEGL